MSRKWRHSGVKVWDNTVGPVDWTDLDLSSYVGACRALVMLKFKNRNLEADDAYYTRTKGETAELITGCSFSGTVPLEQVAYVVIETDADGVIEWKTYAAFLCDVWLVGYVR